VTTRRRLDRLTALRGIAAVVVFSRHWIEAFHPVSGRHVFVQAAGVVSFFFILSGFVLAYGYRPDDRLSSYYRRRVARIYPLYLAGLAVGAVVNHRLLSWAVALPPLALVQSFIPSYRYYYALNGVSWSLSCEAFMYLLFPFLAVRLVRMSGTSRRWLCIALIAAGIALPLIVRSPQQDTGFGYWLLYICPVTRLAEFVLGMLLALSLKEGWKPKVRSGTAGALSVAAIAAGSFVPVYLGWVALTLVPFVLLVPAAAVADLEGRRSWLHARWLVLLGEWSYAFYLLHRAVMAFAEKAIPHPTAPVEVGLFVVTFVAALGVAIVAHRWFERPVERWIRGERHRAGLPASAPAPTVAPA
jgi:peptidoglycan/LPS O-acetylase OafA/YrhL